MQDIVISEFMDDGAVADLARTHDVLYDAALVDRPDALLAAVAKARALIVRNRTQARGALLAAAPRLRVIGRLGVGLDNIDMEACAARGIKVFPAAGANDLSVAEYVISCALTLLRGAYAGTDAVIAGKWPRNAMIGREMSGRVLGLVGFGSIARETARRAIALGMKATAFDPFIKAADPIWAASGVSSVSLDEALRQTDVVSLHVPLTAETRDMINTATLAKMKEDAVLINAARGGVVDEAALAAALKAGKLGGAALDVFAREPLDAAGGAVFAGCPNLILTPHIAGVTEESNVRVSWLTAENVRRALGELA